MANLGTASVAALRQYVRAAAKRNIDSAPLLAEAGLAPELLVSDEGRLDGSQFQHFIRLLCQQVNDPIFGLFTGDFVQPGSYSVLGYITMSCATLGEAITRIAPFEKLVGDMGVTQVRQEGRDLRLVWQCTYTDPVVRPQMVDNVFASWINYARWLADQEEAAPLAVTLERMSPGPALEQEYRNRWRCEVAFNASCNSVVIPLAILDIPLRQPDPLLRQTLEAHALSQMAALDTETALLTRVRHSIHQQLMQGITRQDMIAEHLGMTARTLQRKLSQEGVSYQQLLDDVRQTMAEDYLSNTTLPILDIALRLGFSETTSFHRSFKSRKGMTPGEFRQKFGGE